METSALAPIQTSTGSDGVGATRASLTAKHPDDDTTSPARSRRMIESDSSNADGRVVRRAPIAANWLSSSPRPHWRMKRSEERRVGKSGGVGGEHVKWKRDGYGDEVR